MPRTFVRYIQVIGSAALATNVSLSGLAFWYGLPPAASLALGVLCSALVAWAGLRYYLNRTTDPDAPSLGDRVAATWDMLLRWMGGADRMSDADRELWAGCRHLRDVGRMMSMWLAGEIQARPGYCGPVDVDEDDAPGMTAALIAANKAGFVTTGSQAGCAGTGYDGAHWWGYAAVVGFAAPDTVRWLTEDVAARPGLVITYCRPVRWLDRDGNDPVSFREGAITCDFGNAMPAAEIADDWTGFGICPPDVVRELVAAHQVVIRDTEVGRNDRLWPALRVAAEKRLTGQPRE